MHKSLLVATVTVAALGLSLPVFAQNADTPPPEPANHSHGWHHRHMHSAFLHDLRKLDLSDAQKQAIRQDFRAIRATTESQRRSLWQRRRAFETAVPGSDAYNAAYTAYAQAAATAAQARVQQEADLHSKIYSQLTDAQRSQLANLLAQTPSRPAR